MIPLVFTTPLGPRDPSMSLFPHSSLFCWWEKGTEPPIEASHVHQRSTLSRTCQYFTIWQDPWLCGYGLLSSAGRCKFAQKYCECWQIRQRCQWKHQYCPGWAQAAVMLVEMLGYILNLPSALGTLGSVWECIHKEHLISFIEAEADCPVDQPNTSSPGICSFCPNWTKPAKKKKKSEGVKHQWFSLTRPVHPEEKSVQTQLQI